MLRTQDKRLQLGKDLGCVIPKHRTIDNGPSSLQSLSAAISANTKPASYTTMIASLSFDADGFWIMCTPGTGIADWLLDVAVGAASSEVDLVQNLLVCGTSNSFPLEHDCYIPLPIPAGSRVAARCQSTDGSGTMTISINPVKGPLARAVRKRRATTYGAATADSGGVSLDPGGTINTYPASFTEISASVTNPIESVLICLGGQNNAARTDATHLVQLASGGAGSETVLIDGVPARQSAALDGFTPLWRGPRDLFVPAGTRLAARQQAGINDATDRLMDIVVIGFD